MREEERKEGRKDGRKGGREGGRKEEEGREGGRKVQFIYTPNHSQLFELTRSIDISRTPI